MAASCLPFSLLSSPTPILLLLLIIVFIIIPPTLTQSPPPPYDCLKLRVDGCSGLDWETAVNGDFVPYTTGDCASLPDSPVFYNPTTDKYLFIFNSYGWHISNVCTTTSGPFVAYGDAGDYPFVDTATAWKCAGEGPWVSKPMSITCVLYKGDMATCTPGTYNVTGQGPDGKCHDCPAKRETSFPGATSISDCFTIKGNLVAVSYDVSRITAYNSDSEDHQLLAEGGLVDAGEVAAPTDADFIDGTNFLVTMASTFAVEIMNVEGDHVGKFAYVQNPRGVLFLPSRRKVTVADKAGKEVLFFELNDFKGEALEESDAVSVKMDTLGASEPYYLSAGENDDELLVTTSDYKVVRICVPGSSCKPAIRNRLMMRATKELEGVAVVRAKNTYLVAQRDPAYTYGNDRVLECPLTTIDITSSDCTTFAYRPEGTMFDPYGVLVDELRNLVFVSDRDYSIIHTFSIDGLYLGHLEQTRAFLSQPHGLAMKPGPLAFLSPITPPASATAGVPIITPFTLHDRANAPLPASYNVTKDLPRYQVTATGLVNGLATTIQGSVPSASEANVTVAVAGVWTVSITEGIKNRQHLDGSPYQITVHPAAADPANCEAKFERVLTAGDLFSLEITTADAFGNPTEGAEFEFSCCQGETMSKMGEYTVDVTPAIKGNPFRFDVAPAPPSPLDCEQSLEGITAFDPSTGANLTLQVFAFDEFKNLVPDTARLIVVIDGDINNAIPLLPPTYSHDFHFQPDETREIKISVLLKKEQGTSLEHLPGSPVLIQVAPPPPPASTTTMWIFFGVTLFVILFANYFYSLFAKKKIGVNAERQISVDEKLRKLLDNKIRMQNGMVLIELGDVGSDALNGVLKLLDLLNGADDVVPWLWVLFVIVAAVAVPLGAYQITHRGRVKTSYRAIINGTDEELLEALDENSAVISAESIKIRRTLVALDLSVTKLGLRGLYIEDVPSLVANAVAIVYAMAQHSKATTSTYATLAAFMFSCGMAGRKSGLRALERDLAQKKGELEALENMDEAAKKNRASMHRQQAEIANLQEDLRKKKHSEDELSVMKAAMDGLEEKRKDELKEVLIKSSEVKVSRLLGKGGFGVVNLATYRGRHTAMKQLLTINDESVKRFRFECFLMKSLRHPNIVKLVGVCWEDSLFACCLEFVENGSLEDWLRRTAGGTAYDPSKKKKKKEEVEMLLAESVYHGFDHDGKYDPTLLTAEDLTQLDENLAMTERFSAECSTGASKWEAKLGPADQPLEGDAQCWAMYDSEARCGQAFARIEVSATPAQAFGLYRDKRHGITASYDNLEYLDYCSTFQVAFLTFPSATWGMSDRESLARGPVKKLEGGGFMNCHYQVEDDRKPVAKGAKRIWSVLTVVVKEKEGSGGKVSEVSCSLRIDPKLGGLASLLSSAVAKNSVGGTAEPIVYLKRDVERLLGEYEPQLEKDASGTQSLTWKGQLLQIAVQCALGVQYLHYEQYWADEEKNEDGQIIPAGYRQCIIHRDLKPDNMLLTKDWQLKLTDFGEARAVNLNQTMTSVGTPIYVAPEVMAGNHYDATADSYSFGICLVAMIRGEKDVMEFYLQALRKTMKRKTKMGVGITILNNLMYSKGWRPLLPLEFERSYPKLCKLLKRCWAQKKEDRPSFDQIVKTMQGEVAEEVLRKEEPEIVVYSVEVDAVYHERMGKEDHFGDEREDGMDTTMMVSQQVLTETLEKKDAVFKELQGVHTETLETLETLEKKERIHAETREKNDAVIKELQARIESFENRKEGEDE